ncbi:MAG: PP2C family protein-serine/threonine phosphatase [Limisphaerales bacterium]
MTRLANPVPHFGLRWSAWTERGPIRPNNEDAFLGVCFDAREVHHLGKSGDAPSGSMDFAFAVSDGMGGAKAGEFASSIATEKIAHLLPRSFRQAAVGLETGFTEVLEELFDQIHRALAWLGASYLECAGMEATLSLCWFTPDWLYFGHIGDSRVYYMPAWGQAVKQLTEDDTHVGWLLRQGQLNERQARCHPRRNVLQKALGGANQFVTPQAGRVGYERGDIFLLCTDGLMECLYNEHLLELLRGPGFDSVARRLVEAALAGGARDNVTALVVEVI